MTLGARIARFRKAKGLSQENLADLVGVSRQAVSKWELDEAQPDAAKLVLLAQALEVTTDQLLLGDDNDQSAPTETKPPASSDEMSSPPPGRDYPAALGRFVKKHGYKAGYLLIVYGLVLILFAGGAFALFHGFFTAADESLREFNGFSQSSLFSGWNAQGGVTFEPADGVTLTDEEVALIERELAGQMGYAPPAPTQTHAFPPALQRGVYAVLAIPAVMGLALVVTGVVVIVKFKRNEG